MKISPYSSLPNTRQDLPIITIIPKSLNTYYYTTYNLQLRKNLTSVILHYYYLPMISFYFWGIFVDQFCRVLGVAKNIGISSSGPGLPTDNQLTGFISINNQPCSIFRGNYGQ